ESGRLNNVSDELLARVIKQQPDAIKFLKKQSEELQMLAVESAYAIRESVPVEKTLRALINPTEKVQMLAFKTAYATFEAVTIEDTLLALKKPTENVQMLAVESAFATRENEIIKDTLMFLDNPTEKVQMQIVKQDILLANFIKHPTEKVQNFVLDRGENQAVDNLSIPKDLNKCSKEMQEAAIENDPITIMKIASPSEDLQLLAIRSIWRDGDRDKETSVFQYLLDKCATDKVQMECIKKHPGQWVEYIKKPCVELQEYVLEKLPNLYPDLQYVDEDVIAKGLKEYDLFPYDDIELYTPAYQPEEIPGTYAYDEELEEYQKDYANAVKEYEGEYVGLREAVINRSEKLKNAAIEGNPYNIQYIKNPTIEHQLKAVKANGLSIEVIKNPANIVKEEALKNNIYSALFIDRLTDENARFVLKKGGFPENKIDDLKALPAVAKIFVRELNNKQETIDNIIENLHQKFKVEQTVKNQQALKI
ncbi:MAG: hypothetical protein ACRC26_11550, partial [Bacteroidales bacterium]